VALRRVPRLYCRNERVVIELEADDVSIALVAVGAVLVGSVQLSFAAGEACPAFRKGQELGYFQHGSTIVLLAAGARVLCDRARTGEIVRMGEPLLQQQEETRQRRQRSDHAVRHAG